MAGNYNCAIPRTQRIANVAARTVTFRAPAIADNAPRQLDHLVAARRETRSMKRAREDGHTIAGAPLWAITMRDAVLDKIQRRQSVPMRFSSYFERN
jgi:hypothetical protein